MFRCGLGPKNEERQSETAWTMAQVKERGGGRVRVRVRVFFSFFLTLVSFLARSKPKVPFLGLSLLRNQTETLATRLHMMVTVGNRRLRDFVRSSNSFVRSTLVSLFTRYGNRCTSPMRICLKLLRQSYKLNFY